MMKSRRIQLLAAVGLLSVACVVIAVGRESDQERGDEKQEQSITMNQAPVSAQKALKELAKGASIEKVTKISDEDGDSVTYEGAWKTAGHTREATVSTNGTLMETEEEIDAADVPAAVMAAARRHLGDTSRVVFEKKTKIFYTAEQDSQANSNGSREISIMPDGRVRQAEHEEAQAYEHKEGDQEKEDREDNDKD